MHYSRYIIFIVITVILIFLYNRRVNIVFETLTNMKRPTNTKPWPQNVVKEFLQFQCRKAGTTIEGYKMLIEEQKKEIWQLKQVTSENEKNKNLLQGYKNVIEDLSSRLVK